MVEFGILRGGLPGAPGGSVFLQTPGPGNVVWAIWEDPGASGQAIPNRPAS